MALARRTSKLASKHRVKTTLLVTGLVLVALSLVGMVGCGEESTTTTAAESTTTSEATTTSLASTTASAPTTTASASSTAAMAAERTAGGTAGSGGITISGLGESPTSLTVEELEAMGAETVTVEHPKKGSVEYTGVRFSKVLDALKAKDTATTVTLTASDGYKIDVPLASIKSSPDALLAIDEGTVSSVFPGLETQTWVKDIMAMEFK